MAWAVNNGNWDGQSANTLPEIMAALCLAAKERRVALQKATSYTSFPYTDALDAFKNVPVAADFEGIKANGPCVTAVIAKLRDFVEAFLSLFVRVRDGHTGEPSEDDEWTLADLLDTAGYGTEWIDTHQNDARVWLQLKACFDHMLYARTWRGFSSMPPFTCTFLNSNGAFPEDPPGPDPPGPGAASRNAAIAEAQALWSTETLSDITTFAGVYHGEYTNNYNAGTEWSAGIGSDEFIIPYADVVDAFNIPTVGTFIEAVVQLRVHGEDTPPPYKATGVPVDVCQLVTVTADATTWVHLESEPTEVSVRNSSSPPPDLGATDTSRFYWADIYEIAVYTDLTNEFTDQA